MEIRVLNLLMVALSAVYFPTIARADLSICNKSSDTMQFVMVYEHYHTFGKPPTWPAKGWYEVASGNCKKILTGDVAAFLAISKIRKDHKSFMIPLTIGDISRVRGNGSIGIERALCISTGTVAGYRDRLDDYDNCRKGEYRQLFNIYAQATRRTNYSISLR